MNFGSNGTHPKFTALIHFGAEFTAGKPKILLKTKLFGKTTFLGISNNVSLRTLKNNIILVNLSKKTILWPKCGINFPLGPRQRIIRNSHIACNRIIHLYFPDAKFQFLGICCYQLLQEQTIFFLVQDPTGSIF